MRQQSARILAGASVALLLTAAFLPTAELSAGSSAEARGKELFATKGCAHCHGDAGVGGTIGPDLQLVRKRLDAPAIFRQIHDGGKAMPSFGDQLTEQEINDLVAYLRAKRRLVPVPVGPTPPVAAKPVDKDPD